MAQHFNSSTSNIQIHNRPQKLLRAREPALIFDLEAKKPKAPSKPKSQGEKY